MKALRRILMMLGIVGLVAWAARLRGRGGAPPTGGGWRELEAPDFR